MRSVIRGVALAVLILLVSAIAARQTKLLDRQFIFFPEKELIATPADIGLEFEDVDFSASDGTRLHGWFVPGGGDVTLLWFHGNAGNISHRLDNIAALHKRIGLNIFIFDYRGYGRSEGSVSEKGTYLDADAALQHLRSRDDIDESKVVFFGRSLGCAVAVELATRHQPYALIIESPFTSIQGIARRHYPFLPLGFLFTTRYDSLSKVSQVNAPIMVLHGDRDQTVPMEEGRKLFEAANEPKRFYTIQDADHNDTYVVGGDAYFDALGHFLEDPSGEGS